MEALQLWKKILGKGDGGRDDQSVSQGRFIPRFLVNVFSYCRLSEVYINFFLYGHYIRK